MGRAWLIGTTIFGLLLQNFLLQYRIENLEHIFGYNQQTAAEEAKTANYPGKK